MHPTLVRVSKRLAWLAAVLMSPAIAQSQTVRPLEPSAAAVLDWAEQQFAVLFPGHPTTQTLAPDLLVRHYPATGNLIGVAGNGVWVLGPGTGAGSAPVYVTARTDLACFVYPASCTQASSFPAQALELVVPVAAGSATDTLARTLASALGTALRGVPVAVRNVSGRNTLTGTQAAAAAAPDGQTVLLHTVSLASNTGAYRSPGAGVPESFAFVGLLAEAPMTLVTHAGNAGESAQTMLARARAAPGSLSIGHAGAGSTSHLCALLLQQRLGLSLRMVSYNGSAPLLADTIDRRVDLTCLESHSVLSFVANRQLHGLATLNSRRSSADVLRALPTLAEVSPAGFTLTAWVGLSVPAATPEVVRERLNAALRIATSDAAFNQRLRSAATEAIADYRAGAAGHRAYVIEQARTLGDAFRLANQYAD